MILSNKEPDGTPEDLVIWMVKKAIRDAKGGNGHSQDARSFLKDGEWARLLDVSPETVDRVLAMIEPS